jgi:hypothetical protein
LDTHKNASLTPKGREQMSSRRGGWRHVPWPPGPDHTTPKTVGKWVDRFLAEGVDGLHDRSSLNPKPEEYLLHSCGRPRAAGLTLGNRFQGGDPICHVDVRHHEIQPDHRPRGGAAPCNARLSRRQVRYLEWLSGLLGLILTHRGRCGTLRRVHHSTQCIKSIGYQRLRGPGTPRQHPFPMRTDLLVRCNSAGQDQCG